MTEQEWLECTDPDPMLNYLGNKARHRKLRLFAVACCRNIWHWLSDERSRTAVEVAERFADGTATEEERKLASAAAKAAMDAIYPAHHDYAALAVANAASEDPAVGSKAAAFTAATVADDDDDPTRQTKWTAERLWQTRLLHDIIGNPFRPVTINPAWLAWNDGTVRKIVQSIYDERAFDRLPILADALTDAGCDNVDILNHCRCEGPHVKGCWVVDLLLNKE